MNHLIPTFKI